MREKNRDFDAEWSDQSKVINDLQTFYCNNLQGQEKKYLR